MPAIYTAIFPPISISPFLLSQIYIQVTDFKFITQRNLFLQPKQKEFGRISLVSVKNTKWLGFLHSVIDKTLCEANILQFKCKYSVKEGKARKNFDKAPQLLKAEREVPISLDWNMNFVKLPGNHNSGGFAEESLSSHAWDCIWDAESIHLFTESLVYFWQCFTYCSSVLAPAHFAVICYVDSLGNLTARFKDPFPFHLIPSNLIFIQPTSIVILFRGHIQ